jgi:hypothetical protein
MKISDTNLVKVLKIFGITDNRLDFGKGTIDVSKIIEKLF